MTWHGGLLGFITKGKQEDTTAKMMSNQSLKGQTQEYINYMFKIVNKSVNVLNSYLNRSPNNNVLGAADVLYAGQVLMKIVTEAPHQKPQILENLSENLESVPNAASATQSAKAAGAVKQKILSGVPKAPSVAQSGKLAYQKARPGMPNAASPTQAAKKTGKSDNQKPRPRGAAANHKTLPNKSNAVRAARSLKAAGAAPSQKTRPSAPNAARAAQPRRAAANKNNRPNVSKAVWTAKAAEKAGAPSFLVSTHRGGYGIYKATRARQSTKKAGIPLIKKILPGGTRLQLPATPAMDGEVPPYPLQDLADMDLDIMNITGDPIETALNAKARHHEELMRKCPLPAPTALISTPSRRQNQQAFKAGMSRTVPMVNKAGYWHPSLKEGLRPRVTQLMRNAVYTAENRMKSLTPIIQKIQELADESFTFRLGFVFPRIESQLKGIRNLYTYMMNYRTDKNRQVFIFIFYFRRAMIKYWDIVYMVDRCTVLYNQHVRDVAAGKKLI